MPIKPPYPRVWPEKDESPNKVVVSNITELERAYIKEAAGIAGVSVYRWMRVVLCNEALCTVKTKKDRWTNEPDVKYVDDDSPIGSKPAPPQIPFDVELD